MSVQYALYYSSDAPAHLRTVCMYICTYSGIDSAFAYMNQTEKYVPVYSMYVCVCVHVRIMLMYCNQGASVYMNETEKYVCTYVPAYCMYVCTCLLYVCMYVCVCIGF